MNSLRAPRRAPVLVSVCSYRSAQPRSGAKPLISADPVSRKSESAAISSTHTYVRILGTAERETGDLIRQWLWKNSTSYRAGRARGILGGALRKLPSPRHLRPQNSQTHSNRSRTIRADYCSLLPHANRCRSMRGQFVRAFLDLLIRPRLDPITRHARNGPMARAPIEIVIRRIANLSSPI